MVSARAAFGHVWEVGVIVVLFVAYVVGLVGATVFAKAKKAASRDSSAEVDVVESPRI